MGIDVSLTGIPSFDQLELIGSGITTLTFSDLTKSAVGIYSSGGNAQISHNLGFTPIPLAFWAAGSVFIAPGLPITATTISSGAYYGATTLNISIDSNNLYLAASQLLWIMSTGSVTLPGGTFNVKYYLLRERANS